jgi:UDP-N-acetylmuramoyl-tripeptide--D-alanyl-D-alanine ligase
MSEQAILELPDAGAAADALKKSVRRGDVVLVKGSRGMRMEQIVQSLTGMKAVTKQAS